MNIYISNLGLHVTDADLKKLFSLYGEVSSVKIVTDKITGMSRRFGFVQMPRDTDAKTAMQKLQHRELEGRAISVSQARQIS